MNHTVSFDIAKKLQESGWEKECYFISAREDESVLISMKGHTYDPEKIYWRSMLHELLEELPKIIRFRQSGYQFDYDYYLIIDFEEGQGCIGYIRNSAYCQKEAEDNIQDAAALLWIWCKENGYLSNNTK